jgi:uncharacterized protein YndB with AHSA1/START domain
MIVRQSVTVSAPAESAFRVFTEEIGQWWPLAQGFAFLGEKAKDMILEGRVGGRLLERGTDGTEHVIGEVRTYEPPTRVGFTWNDSDGTTEVEVRFDPPRPPRRQTLLRRERPLDCLRSGSHLDRMDDLLHRPSLDHVLLVEAQDSHPAVVVGVEGLIRLGAEGLESPVLQVDSGGAVFLRE